MTKRTLAVVGALVSAVVFLVSCEPPLSKNPLSDPAKAVADTRLNGVWAGVMGDDANTSLTIVPSEGAGFDVVLVGSDTPKGAVVLTFSGFPSTVGGKTYWNLRSKTFTGSYADGTHVAAEYIFVRYEIAKDGSLRLWQMDDELVKAAVKAGTLEGTVGSNGDVNLTASSEKLGAHLTGLSAADDAKEFVALGTFKKVKFDYPKPAKAPAAKGK